jgi:transcription-repair coupling factor (superfamily II helicase)
MNEDTKTGLNIALGDEVSPTAFAAKLTNLCYENISPGTIAKAGEFSKRGGLVDIWLERYKVPVRIDLIGERVENIYLFNIFTQGVLKRLKEVYIIARGITPKIAPKWTKQKKFPLQTGESVRLFLSEIEPGDLVVHIDHGIGKFLGVSSSRLAKRQEFARQYLIVEYAKGDKLFVPVDQIERVTKYIGVGGRKVPLSYLGTGAWEKTRQKVAESVNAYAKELLELYAKRQLSTRVGVGSDTPWQKQLEEAFEYEETSNQLKATGEIKDDLEGTHPMDRVLVGDVGFGKTEVAIRAAFKVVQSGRQVAILVPTTVLAEQHYHLFKERLQGFPVKVEKLSRFEEKEKQSEVAAELKNGSVDIVIGTHRLLSEDVEFKNLGLLIIDEEHRFGVKHKEKLKTLKPAIDVLSMSATPIPRTLNLALTTLRDMSVLSEAPAGRKPIETSVGEFDEEKVKVAIEKEIARGGQVYYVFNRVQKIASKTAEIQKLLPSARVAFAHGQMDRRINNSELRIKNLEKVVDDFYEKKYDILVCTTIIGSGLDMPNVNTIIIENAQSFGLSELYQLRGRVGRSERKAYAYLFYPKNYVPEGESLERLAAIVESSELGSGFKIAKHDLEIRGSGNLLGTAQSGNIALIGFELYVQLLSQGIEKLKLER